MSELAKLFLAFNRIGAFTFGGGYAMLPLLTKELVEKNNWVTNDELLDYFAIGQCTPGVIAVNVATFVGTKVGGIFGAAIATLGVVLPSFLIILLIAALLQNFIHLPAVVFAFNGIRVAVAVLVLNTIIGLFNQCVKNALAFFIVVVSFLYMLLVAASPVYMIAVAIVVGLVMYLWKGRG